MFNVSVKRRNSGLIDHLLGPGILLLNMHCMLPPCLLQNRLDGDRYLWRWPIKTKLLTPLTHFISQNDNKREILSRHKSKRVWEKGGKNVIFLKLLLLFFPFLFFPVHLFLRIASLKMPLQHRLFDSDWYDWGYPTVSSNLLLTHHPHLLWWLEPFWVLRVHFFPLDF